MIFHQETSSDHALATDVAEHFAGAAGEPARGRFQSPPGAVLSHPGGGLAGFSDVTAIVTGREFPLPHRHQPGRGDFAASAGAGVRPAAAGRFPAVSHLPDGPKLSRNLPVIPGRLTHVYRQAVEGRHGTGSMTGALAIDRGGSRRSLWPHP